MCLLLLTIKSKTVIITILIVISYFFADLYDYLIYPVISASDWTVRHLATLLATLFVALGAFKFKKKLESAEEKTDEINAEAIS